MCWCQTVFYDWLAAIPATLEDHIFRYRGRAEGGQLEALFIGALCFDYWTDPNPKVQWGRVIFAIPRETWYWLSSA